MVLHYLNKQQLYDALNELYSVLKPNGKLFIVARNNKEWQFKKPEFVISYDEKPISLLIILNWKKEN